jgi:hypothetical protein
VVGLTRSTTLLEDAILQLRDCWCYVMAGLVTALPPLLHELHVLMFFCMSCEAH